MTDAFHRIFDCNSNYHCIVLYLAYVFRQQMVFLLFFQIKNKITRTREDESRPHICRVTQAVNTKRRFRINRLWIETIEELILVYYNKDEN